MGTFTEIRVRATIKPEYSTLIELLWDSTWTEILDFSRLESESEVLEKLCIFCDMTEEDLENWKPGIFNRYNELREMDLSFIEKWLNQCDDYINCIPFGCSAYFDQDPEWEHNFNEETRYWQFQCNFKNYTNAAEYFFENVLPVITEEVHEAWQQHEYDDKAARLITVNCI